MKDEGIFDRCGLIDSLQTLLGDVEIRGRRNAQLLLLVAQGLDTLKDGLLLFGRQFSVKDGIAPVHDEIEGFVFLLHRLTWN